jgi:membrane protease YdiL (CAAX protease family)
MPLFMDIVGVALLSWGLMVWLLIAVKLAKREPVLPQEPRRPVPWEWFDVAAIVVAFIAFLFLSQFIAVELCGLDPAQKWSELDARGKLVLLAADLAARIATFLVGIAILRSRSSATLDDIGLTLGPAAGDVVRGAATFLAAAPVVFGLQAIVTQLIPYKHQLLEAVQEKGSLPMWIVATLSAAIAAPIMEEFLFRVVLQGWLEKLEAVACAPDKKQGWLGLPRGGLPIVISSLLFALMHFREGNESAWLRLLAVAPLFVLGLFLGFVYQRTHRMLPSVVVHMLLNGTTLTLLFAGAG